MKQVSVFDKIDNYYENQPNNNTFLLSILMLVVVVGYLIYDYTYMDSEDYVSENYTKLEESKNKLNELNSFLERNKSNLTIQRLNQDLLNLKKHKEDVDKQNSYFDGKLREASRLLYNQKNWSMFMSKINTISEDYKLVLGDVKSSINDLRSRNVEEAFNVSFNLEGKYQNILHFINSLESSVDVVDVKSLKISSIVLENIKLDANNKTNLPMPNLANKDNIKAEVVISIWGIKY